jgi:EAL and modified HD-GYP domain-containing signal transduction protein
MSLADALFSISMADILENVEVAHDVRAALLDREGEFGTMLRVAELLEAAEGGCKLYNTLRKLDLSVAQIREIELRAFDWVRELTHEVH